MSDASVGLDVEEHENARRYFGRVADNLSIFREALIDHGYDEEQAVRFGIAWLQTLLRTGEED